MPCETTIAGLCNSKINIAVKTAPYLPSTGISAGHSYVMCFAALEVRAYTPPIYKLTVIVTGILSATFPTSIW